MHRKFITPYRTEVFYITEEYEIITNEEFENSESKNRFSFVYENDINEKIKKLIIQLNNSMVLEKKSIIVIYENKEIKVFKNVTDDFKIPLNNM